MPSTSTSRPSSAAFAGTPGAPWWAAAVALVVLALAGCSGEGMSRVSVSGTVDMDGAPLAKGSIVFVPIESTPGPQVAGIIENGQFTLIEERGPVVGEYRVEIYADQGLALEEPEVAASLPGHKLPPNPVGAQFNKQSTLTATISEAPEPLHFDVTD